MHRAFRPAIPCLAVLVLAGSAASEPYLFEPIARTGDAVPGSTAEVFDFFSAPALNEAGDVAFAARPRGEEEFTGVFATRGDTLGAVARRGDLVPRAAATFSRFGDPILNDAGDVAFFAEFDGSGGVFATRGGSLQAVALTGDLVPGGAPGETFTEVGRVLALNDTGGVAFGGRFGGTEGIFVANDDGLTAVARTGDPVPGGASGETFDVFSSPVLNDAGEVAFSAGFGSSSGVFVTRGGEPTPVVRTGDPVPGATRGETFAFSSPQLPLFGTPRLNSAGDVTFVADFDRGKSTAGAGIFASRRQGNRIEVVARTSDPLPGGAAGETLGGFISPAALNDAGDVVFAVFVEDAEITSQNALLITRDGALVTVFRTASTTPLDRAVLNGVGEVAFREEDIQTWLWVTSDGEPSLIAGPEIVTKLVSGEVVRVDVAQLQGAFTGNGNSPPSGFNDAGQIAIAAELVEPATGFFGIFVGTPASVSPN